MPRLTLAPRLVLAALALLALPALADERIKPPADAHLYIGWPNDGEVVRSPFKVWFGLRGMGVSPKDIRAPETGHHHLLIDTPLPPLDEPIPSDRNHLHFGNGETETVVTLPPGKHTLQLMLGDYDHKPFDPPVVSKKITVTVK